MTDDKTANTNVGHVLKTLTEALCSLYHPAQYEVEQGLTVGGVYPSPLKR